MRVELNQVRISFEGGAEHAGRAELVSRLACEYLAEMLAGRPGPPAVAEIDRLEISPVRVALDPAGEEAAARAVAAEIHRALLHALNR